MSPQTVRLVVAAMVIAIAVPACGMAFCAMDMTMGSMPGCESMGLSFDTAGGVLAGVLFFSLLAMTTIAFSERTHAESTSFVPASDAPPPRPPDDPLMGRLIL
jgi:hypothetical protein